ncbi:MAG: hypothetical protein LBP33_08330 [Candidatus Adiutrix sp.]|jgi:hypothetical protein|nr:hypothetical protein [Candidatus Adiutrix sp.]
MGTDTKFKKGQSGNPGGQRAIPKEVKDFLAGKTMEAARKLVLLLNSKDGNLRLKAANSILDRVYGKPDQAHTFNGDLGGKIVVKWQS